MADDCVRLSRLGRLPLSSNVDLSLPSRTEGALIASNNVSLDSIHPRVYRSSDRHGKQQHLNAFLQAKLEMEKKEVTHAHKEERRHQTESRSKEVLHGFKKQHAETAPPKHPWRYTTRPVSPKYEYRQMSDRKAAVQRASRGVAGREVSDVSKQLDFPAEVGAGPSVANVSPEKGYPTQALWYAASNSSPSVPTPHTEAGGSSLAHTFDCSVGNLLVRSARELTPDLKELGASPEITDVQACEVDAVAIGLTEGSGEAADDDEAADDPTADSSALLVGDFEELTMREGVVAMEDAEEEGGEETTAATEMGEPPVPEERPDLPAWTHPLKGLQAPGGLESSVRLVTSAGQRARENLARHMRSESSPSHQAEDWCGDADDACRERECTPVDIHSPFKTVILHRFGDRSESQRVEAAIEPAPRTKTPTPTRLGGLGLREELRPLDPNSAVYPSRMHSRPWWSASWRAAYEARAREAGVTLPALCGCHTVSLLDPKYPTLCSRNCPLYNNFAAWEGLVKTVLASYGLL